MPHLPASLARLGLALTLLGSSACTSSPPTLPLPPPATIDAPGADGLITLWGTGSTPDALVMAFNEDALAGVIGVVEEDGTYTLRLAAAPGDTISYWQRLGTDDTGAQSGVVPAP